MNNILLDSNLITQTNRQLYNVKMVRCGSYIQCYYYDNIKSKKILYKEKKIIINELELTKPKNINLKKEIEYKNIIRSKILLQRIVKANIKDFKTFITLTFKDNVSNIPFANKKLNIFLTQIRRVKKDFKYVCVPEFQKRGVIHYHLLTNLDIDIDNHIILKQKNKNNMYDVKYWSYGFSSVFKLDNINVVGYLSKYLSKDYDNRFYGFRKFMYSQNLQKPIIDFLYLDKDRDFIHYLDIVKNANISFKSNYIDTYNNINVSFIEYKI